MVRLKAHQRVRQAQRVTLGPEVIERRVVQHVVNARQSSRAGLDTMMSDLKARAQKCSRAEGRVLYLKDLETEEQVRPRVAELEELAVNDPMLFLRLTHLAAHMDASLPGETSALAFAAAAVLLEENGRWSGDAQVACRFSGSSASGSGVGVSAGVSSGSSRGGRQQQRAGRAGGNSEDTLLACLAPRLAAAMSRPGFPRELAAHKAEAAAPAVAAALLRACAAAGREGGAAARAAAAALAQALPAAAAAAPDTSERRRLVVATARLAAGVLPGSAAGSMVTQELWAALAAQQGLLQAALRLAGRCGTALGDEMKARHAEGRGRMPGAGGRSAGAGAAGINAASDAQDDAMEAEMAGAVAACLAAASALLEAGAELDPEAAKSLVWQLWETAQQAVEWPVLAGALLQAEALERAAATAPAARPDDLAAAASGVAVSAAVALRQWCARAAKGSLLEVQATLPQAAALAALLRQVCGAVPAVADGVASLRHRLALPISILQRCNAWFAGDARLLELPSTAPLCGDAGCRGEPLRRHLALLADAAAGLLSDTTLQLLNPRSRRRLGRDPAEYLAEQGAFAALTQYLSWPLHPTNQAASTEPEHAALNAVFAAAGWLESCHVATGSGAQAQISGEAAGAVAAAVSAALACTLRRQPGSNASAAGVQQRQRGIATGMDILARMLLSSSPPAGGAAPVGGTADSAGTRAGNSGSAAGGSAGSPAAAKPSGSAHRARGDAPSPVYRAALQHGAVEALVAALPTAAGMPEDAVEDELRGALAALAAVADASRRGDADVQSALAAAAPGWSSAEFALLTALLPAIMTAVRPHIAAIDIAMQKLSKAKATAGGSGGGGSSRKTGGGSRGCIKDGGKGAAGGGGPAVHKKAELLKQAWGAGSAEGKQQERQEAGGQTSGNRRSGRKGGR